MKLASILIVTSDMKKSIEFYNKVLGLEVVLDYGANKTLTGNLVLQTEETWKEFIEGKDVTYKNNSYELYFEVPTIDDFICHLETLEKEGYKVCYVHKIKEHSWGQRVVRIYDPNYHILEIAEEIDKVMLRFRNQGMSNQEVATRMDMPLEVIDNCIGKNNKKN